MTEDHQNVDTHDCVKGYVLNRVGGNQLDSTKPQKKLKDMPNGEFIFGKDDHIIQRTHYKVLIQRVLVDNIICLKSFTTCVLRHIPHKHSSEMSSQCQMVCFKTFF